MIKIANIVTTAKKHNYSEMFNVVNTINDCIDDLPTLIVGWSNVKKIYDNANILEKECNGVKWTFSKTERRCDYEEDIINFYEYAIKNAVSNIKYVYVDLLKFSLTQIKKTIAYLRNDNKKTIFLTKGSQFMFVYGKEYNTVFGISLSLCEYMNINKRKIINMVNNAEFIGDTEFINSDIRRIIGNNTAYILPLYDYIV